MSYSPRKEEAWLKANNGVYELNDDFYKTSGGIFDPMPHYEEMFAAKVSKQPCLQISGAAFEFTNASEVELQIGELEKNSGLKNGYLKNEWTQKLFTFTVVCRNRRTNNIQSN